MNQNNFRNYQFSLSGLSFWLTLLAIFWLLGAIGLGWLVKSIFILIAFLLITPILVLIGAQWWLRQNVVQDQCPVCGFEFAGVNGMQTRCPNCSEPLKIEHKHFQRLTLPGTVDVEAIEVPAQKLEGD